MMTVHHKDLVRMVVAFVLLTTLSLIAILAGHTPPPAGKSCEWLNEKTVFFLPLAMFLAGLATHLIRGLRFRFVIGAFLLNAVVTGCLMLRLSKVDRSRVSYEDAGFLLVLMIVGFFFGYMIGRIFERQRGEDEQNKTEGTDK